MPQTNLDAAKVLSQRICAEIAKLKIKQNDAIKVTVSIGIAQLTLDETDTELLSKADKMLYRAKDQGKNQVSY
jgi:diguanylate cyclase (GGDEF)-like protein